MLRDGTRSSTTVLHEHLITIGLLLANGLPAPARYEKSFARS